MVTTGMLKVVSQTTLSKKFDGRDKPVHKWFANMFHDNRNAEFPYVPVAKRKKMSCEEMREYNFECDAHFLVVRCCGQPPVHE